MLIVSAFARSDLEVPAPRGDAKKVAPASCCRRKRAPQLPGEVRGEVRQSYCSRPRPAGSCLRRGISAPDRAIAWPSRRSGRVAEGGALLRRYGGELLHRGFESLLLRSLPTFGWHGRERATLSVARRGGRAVECGGLENRYGSLGSSRVQIPPSPLARPESAYSSGVRPGSSSIVRQQSLRSRPLETAHSWRALARNGARSSDASLPSLTRRWTQTDSR